MNAREQSILATKVALYPGHSPEGAPQWVGVMDDFWQANQDAFRWGDIIEIARDLRRGVAHYVGGGAQAAFTLTRPPGEY